MPGVVAALASGLFFGALHAPTGLETVPQLVIFGAILALLYDKTGSIVPGLILHVLNNTVALIAQ
jgi:membrane protease YdiL (CAAX protease family)